MVQIIPRTQQTFGEKVASGIDKGVDFGNKLLFSKYENELKNKNKQQEIANKQQLINKYFLSEEGKKLDPFVKQIIEGEAIGIIPAGTGKSLIEMMDRQKKQDFLSDILSDEKEDLNQPQEQMQSNQNMQPMGDQKSFNQNENIPQAKIQKISDDKLMKMIGMGGDIGNVAKAEIDRRNKDREFNLAKEKMNFLKGESLRKETLPLRTNIAERGELARRGIENKQKQIELIDTGNINDPSFAILMDSLPLKFGHRFLSPETVQYKSGLVQGYGDLKTIFTGATRVKEVEILENKLADLYLTDQQKKAILKSTIDAQKVDVIKEEAAAELEAQGKNYGVLQFNKELNKIAQPKINALFNKILDEQQFILKDAENRKKIPLNENDPEDAQVIDQILQEAGGDWRKAEKLAKQKGYKF